MERGVRGPTPKPHLAIDPSAIASQMVSRIYQVVSRPVDVRYPCLITFGCTGGRGSPNVIPDTIGLLGPIRSSSDSSSALLVERI